MEENFEMARKVCTEVTGIPGSGDLGARLTPGSTPIGDCSHIVNNVQAFSEVALGPALSLLKNKPSGEKQTNLRMRALLIYLI
ncbi:hypothetical protein ElyMa_001900900 [Elysia marginata]|uniref:Uncharacterized protein n=1 Tax=Elysia marginata TaxID=1093978 RepID=A0AAV4ERA1_9GAST|nr:hypothetical protein ElyMa_001900900 [Elysia marginata]